MTALKVSIAAGALGAMFVVGLVGGRAVAPQRGGPPAMTKVEVARLAPVAALPSFRPRVRPQPRTATVIVG